MDHLDIIASPPRTWKMLQEFVATVLSDCGFVCSIEKIIRTARENIEIDVYAERNGSFNTKLLCECKYWNKNVPKNVIHSLRTIIEDSGANQGIVISKNGFQTGAYEAVKNSNVSLFSWKEFQQAFKKEYLEQVIIRNYRKGHELMQKGNSVIQLNHNFPDALADREFDAFQYLREEHSNFIFYTLKDNYENLDTKEITIHDVERGIKMGEDDLKINVSSLKEYFDFIYSKCEDGIQKIDSLLEYIGYRINQQSA